MSNYMVSEMKIPCEKCKSGSLRIHVNSEGLYIKCDSCGHIEKSPQINPVKNKPTLKEDLEKLLDEQIAFSNKLCPDEESDAQEGEEIFDEGRGQGIYETCIKIKELLKGY